MKKTGERSWFIRIVAFLLAITITSSAVLYVQTGTKVRPGDYSNRAEALALEQLMQSGDYANASRLERMGYLLREAIEGKKTPKDYDLAAQRELSRGEYEAAAENMEVALLLMEETDPARSALETRLGLLYTLAGDYDAAYTWLSKNIESTGSAPVRLARAQVCLNRDDVPGAVSDLNAYLEAVGGLDGAEDMLPNVVNIFLAAEDFENALACYDRMLAKENTADSLLGRAYCLARLGRVEEAEQDRAAYETAGGKELAQADVFLGLAWMKVGNVDAAAACFQKAGEEDYPSPETLTYYTMLCGYSSGDYRRAADQGDLLMAGLNADGTVALHEVGVENETGLAQVIAREIPGAEVCRVTGASHLALADYKAAVTSLTTGIDTGDTDPYARYLRGSALLALGKFETALSDFDVTVAAECETEKSRFNRAVCLVALHRDGAAEDLNWVLQNGTDPALRQEAATLLENE